MGATTQKKSKTMSASKPKRTYLRSRSPSGPGGQICHNWAAAWDRGLALAIMVQTTLQGIVKANKYRPFWPQNLPSAAAIHEQKQWSATESRRANRPYRT